MNLRGSPILGPAASQVHLAPLVHGPLAGFDEALGGDGIGDGGERGGAFAEDLHHEGPRIGRVIIGGEIGAEVGQRPGAQPQIHHLNHMDDLPMRIPTFGKPIKKRVS